MSHEKAIGTEKFRYPVDGGEIVLPNLKRVKAGVIRKVRNLDDIDQMFTLFELLSSPEQLALIDELETDELEDLAQKWRDFSGTSAGE